MITTKEQLSLPEGTYTANVEIFEDRDAPVLYRIYKNWRQMSNDLQSLGGRAVNVPDVLSEGVLALTKGYYRLNNPKLPNGVNGTMDNYDPNSPVHQNRIQAKACSIEGDCTSFGPKTEWDKLYFMDFYSNGKWDGTFHVYEIPNVDNIVVNKGKNETVKDQKKQGRRPRFSIKTEFVETGRYLSKETYKLTPTGIVKINVLNG